MEHYLWATEEIDNKLSADQTGRAFVIDLSAENRTPLFIEKYCTSAKNVAVLPSEQSQPTYIHSVGRGGAEILEHMCGDKNESDEQKNDLYFTDNVGLFSKISIEYKKIKGILYNIPIISNAGHAIPMRYLYFEDYIGTKKEFVEEIIKEIAQMSKEKIDEKITLYINKSSSYGHGWSQSFIPRRPFSSVFQNSELIKNIISDLDKFKSMRKKFEERSVKYKRNYLFHGPPGNGKTSMIIAMATYTGRSLYKLQAASKAVSDDDLSQLYSTIGPNSILVIEDVDSLFNNHRESNNGLTFSTFINMLDGMQQNNGLITVMTTNHLSLLDNSLIRSSRVDIMFDVSKITAEMVSSMMKAWLDLTPAGDIDKITKPVHKLILEKNLSMASLQSVLIKIYMADITDIETIHKKIIELLPNEISGLDANKMVN